jgi:hypothetical protein
VTTPDRRIARLGRLSAAWLCFAAFLCAWGADRGGGTISGRVYGGSGIVVPNAMVGIVNDSTGKQTGAQASTAGEYRRQGLEAGWYTVRVTSMSGFPEQRVTLHDGEALQVDLHIRKFTLPSEFAKAPVLTMAELAKRPKSDVEVVELSDYVYGGYSGDFSGPTHADVNPRRAVVVVWKDFDYRFVLSHEASYCPFIELSSGPGSAFQFFEGNDGWAELLNQWGRRERNSFVDIVESGPKRVWVRWTYVGVNIVAGESAYRAVEDFWAYPNGLIVRRQTYETLRPGDYRGYTREPVEMMVMCPVGQLWFDVLSDGPHSAEKHALAVLDTFSPKRYDVFWTRKPETLLGGIPRRAGSPWRDLDDAAGVALVAPLKTGAPFTVFGDASGFRHDYTRIKDHSFPDTGGIGWVSQSWDHWPIGWANSQGHEVDEASLHKYPNSFSPVGMDFFALPNEESERGVYFSLLGVGGSDFEKIRQAGGRWLALGYKGIANPDNVAAFPRLTTLPSAHNRRKQN